MDYSSSWNSSKKEFQLALQEEKSTNWIASMTGKKFRIELLNKEI